MFLYRHAYFYEYEYNITILAISTKEGAPKSNQSTLWGKPGGVDEEVCGPSTACHNFSLNDKHRFYLSKILHHIPLTHQLNKALWFPI